jgi:hypothetical protein
MYGRENSSKNIPIIRPLNCIIPPYHVFFPKNGKPSFPNTHSIIPPSYNLHQKSENDTCSLYP